MSEYLSDNSNLTWQCTVAHHPRPLVALTRQLPRVLIPITADFRCVAVTPVPRMRWRCHIWTTRDCKDNRWLSILTSSLRFNYSMCRDCLNSICLKYGRLASACLNNTEEGQNKAKPGLNFEAVLILKQHAIWLYNKLC